MLQRPLLAVWEDRSASQWLSNVVALGPQCRAQQSGVCVCGGGGRDDLA